MKILYKLVSIFLIILLSNACQSEKQIKILLLSGSNNHDWKSTTPLLENTFAETGLFNVEITEKPDTLKAIDINRFDVIVSNWNSWPENDVRWDKDLEMALLNFVKTGGGFVTIHAASSAFYNWPEFKDLTTAAWVLDTTWHGKKSATEVDISNQNHPITKGMSGFYIYDELWVKAEENSNFNTLALASNSDIVEKGIEPQPTVMVAEYGRGKVFHTSLGHDTRTMRNSGFQTLLLRGTEWAATGKVTQSIPQELQQVNNSEKKLNWTRTDSSLALFSGKEVLWKYNFNEKQGKPFFHPVYVGRNNITCVSPDDHKWHVGQWFSWKFINGVNYWEYQNGTFQSAGVTEITNFAITQNSDFSAKIDLDIVYHSLNGDNVLQEKRTISVLPPRNDGSISMNYTFNFTALADSVDLNRTPIPGEPEGKSWGGYAGLSIRFNQDFMDSYFISSWGDDEINGQSGNWLYMGFTGLNGQNVGSQIIISPDTKREGAAWYAVNTDDLPFYYFSPAYLYKKPLLLLKGEELKLHYRINHLAGKTNYSELEKEFQNYIID